MNINIKTLIEKATTIEYGVNNGFDHVIFDKEKFAELMLFDLLNDITNDDSLGTARIDTVERLAKKWGVSKNERANSSYVGASN